MSTRLMTRTERLAAVEQMLFRSALGLRVVEIADECGVDRRTIYRDLTLLSDIGVPIHQKDGRFFIDRENYAASIRLNFDETVALFLASRVASRHLEQHNPHLTSALNKLGNALPAPLASHIEHVIKTSGTSPADLRYLTVLETVARAWAERRKVKIWCSDDDGAPTARDFCPYFIEPAVTGAVYVIGFDSLTQRVQTFKLQRIRRVRLLQAIFQIPAQFDPRRYLGSAWGGVGGDPEARTTVVLVFSAQAALAIQESHWRGSQRVEPLEDRRMKMTFQVSDWREMIGWIRSWGAQVEVVEPQTLREECAREAAELAHLYAAPGA